MKFDRHLFLTEVILPPSGEWTDSSVDWRLMRLSKGAAYWLGEGEARELKEGEVVAMAPSSKGCLRASQIGEVKLHCFHFCPELLSGFLSLSERHYFQTVALDTGPAPRFLPATHPASEEFAAMAAQPVANNLLLRCQLMHLVASIFAEEMSRHQPQMAKSAAAQTRFKQLINEMPDGDLLKYTPEQLARLCGCSVRHFSRLFRKHFGTAIRVKQTELRLLKARQLLTDTDAKIIHVALESGYRHLGLFNSMFKKYLGMTPSEWRTKNLKNLKKPRAQKISRAASLFAAACLLIFPIGAVKGEVAPTQVATNSAAPVTATTNAPANPTNTTVLTFPVDGYEITGNTLFQYSDIEPILKKYVGPAVSFDSIRKAVAEFQMAYRNRGFVTVAVSLPAQDLTNGLVKLQVTEGRLTEINVVNNRYFSSNNIIRALPSLQTNLLLNSLVFQRDLDRANANRDRQIYPVIGPGPDPGTTALNLKVKDRIPVHGRLEFNNYATPGTPDLRLNASAQYNNLWQLEHQAGLQYSFSPEALKAVDQMPAFYDQPLIANYSGFYRLPLDFGKGSDRGHSYGISDFGYDEASKRFRGPPARDFPELLMFASRSFTDTGYQLQSESLTQPADFSTNGGLQIRNDVFSQTIVKNEGIGLRFSEPLPTLWGLRASFSAGFDYKSYRSEGLQRQVSSAQIYVPVSGRPGEFTIITPSNAPPPIDLLTHDSVQYFPFALGFDSSKPDKGGFTSFNAGLSVNFAGLFDNQAAFRHATGATNIDGRYVILTAGLTREQNLPHDWGMRLHMDGQWANQSLLNNEQFGIGGLAGVRGYRDGQEYGDTGWRVLVEPHTPLFKVPLGEQNTLQTLVRASIFTDYGERYLLHTVPGRAGSLAMWGAGFAISATRGEHLDLRLTYGIPLLDVPGVPAWHPRFTFAVSAQF